MFSVASFLALSISYCCGIHSHVLLGFLFQLLLLSICGLVSRFQLVVSPTHCTHDGRGCPLHSIPYRKKILCWEDAIIGS